MPASPTDAMMNDVHCEQDTSLTEAEKSVFAGHLERHGLSDNIWDLFAEWVARSTSQVNFFYLKVYLDHELIGLALFLKIKPYDLRTSYSATRNNPYLNRLFSVLSTLTNNCVYVSFRNLITSNITRPFFYRDPGLEDTIMDSILTHLKRVKEADMVTILDTSTNDHHYRRAGFAKYPSSSEAWLDATRYSEIAGYLKEHRSLRRNLSRRKGSTKTEIQHGLLSDIDRAQLRDCLDCSVENSRINTPCQKFFEDNIFETEVFESGKYVHILIRVEGRIAGFHTFQVSGSNMGGVLGGFHRTYSRGNFLYERVIVASLDYAIQNQLGRVNYSVIDNHTKLRLVTSLEPCGLYFYSRSALNRRVFSSTFKFNDIHQLYSLERNADRNR
jgi:hypothetical protein